MGRQRCPNCEDGGLIILREEHQQAGERKVWLRWMICSRCHHVALDNWSFADVDTDAAHELTGSGGPSNQADACNGPGRT
jgi:hypothetical protein